MKILISAISFLTDQKVVGHHVMNKFPGQNYEYFLETEEQSKHNKNAGSRYFCESLFWAPQPKQAAKT
jgi:hypothetical protein